MHHPIPEDEYQALTRQQRILRVVLTVIYITLVIAFGITLNSDFVPLSPFLRVIIGCISLPAVPATCVLLLIQGFRRL